MACAVESRQNVLRRESKKWCAIQTSPHKLFFVLSHYFAKIGSNFTASIRHALYGVKYGVLGSNNLVRKGCYHMCGVFTVFMYYHQSLHIHERKLFDFRLRRLQKWNWSVFIIVLKIEKIVLDVLNARGVYRKDLLMATCELLYASATWLTSQGSYSHGKYYTAWLVLCIIVSFQFVKDPLLLF